VNDSAIPDDNNNGSDTLSQSEVGSIPSTPMKATPMATAARLEAPEPKDLQELLPSGTLLVHFYRYQLIGRFHFIGIHFCSLNQFFCQIVFNARLS
jgi:hypothetical protein